MIDLLAVHDSDKTRVFFEEYVNVEEKTKLFDELDLFLSQHSDAC